MNKLAQFRKLQIKVDQLRRSNASSSQGCPSIQRDDVSAAHCKTIDDVDTCGNDSGDARG
ncbi:hypothetical protein [Bradyrhizobium sp. CCBAU 53351]|uniref:hypothetical protein n=1 Tax=Bradyrhizobium sp. CCBAU 53351 TaxID=1325114 RepID=UPI001888BE52|nr:hypothetical protein [Bradyrhizobium sp. CCBAU 53351]